MIRDKLAQAVHDIARTLRDSSGRVFVQAATGEPLGLADAFAEAPETAQGLTFIGGWIPGANRIDWGGLSPHSRAEGLFIGPEWHSSFAQGRFAHRPLPYSGFDAWLSQTPLDAALVQVAPPAADGMVSLGISVDFVPTVLTRDVFKVAVINPAMPAPASAPKVPLSQFHLCVEDDHPLLTYDVGQLDSAFATIASHIAALVPDGATVQLGLGKVGVAALAGLSGRRGLAIYSGMVTDPLLALLDQGAVLSVTTGVALGSPALYERCAQDPRLHFASVSQTHALSYLAGLPRFVAVNSALEIDLFGQANAEWLNGQPVSGIGGLSDFLRGARQSPGGLGILALNATAHGGRASRIVPRLQCPTVSVPRGDFGFVVTEFGTADLRFRDLDGRAEALIDIAAPDHRIALSEAWAQMRRGF